MNILIAEDEAIACRLLEATLLAWQHEVVVCSNGRDALDQLSQDDGPPLAILDWMMPGLDGPDVCREVRQTLRSGPPRYLILLTANDRREDAIAGLEAGADDYVTKPFDPGELRARVQAGVRVIELQRALVRRLEELKIALSQVKQLQGLLPICSYCKKIRDDHNYWSQLESYISQHSDVRFSHGICPGCYERVVKESDNLS